MNLVIILLSLAIEHFNGIADSMRSTGWFLRYMHVIENRCNHYPFWQGPLGVIITLAGPLLVVALVVGIFIKVFYPMALVVSLVCLLYSLKHGSMNTGLNDYVSALETGDVARIQQLDAELSLANDDDDRDPDRVLLEGILVQANERLFAVLFWFSVLGPFGAVLYRLTVVLLQEHRDIHGGYSEKVRDLYDILNWPASRLFALGNALAGNMVDAMQAWREAEQGSFTVNESVISSSGLGALNYHPTDTASEQPLEERIYWIHALRSMLNRTLLVWLTVLGLMTISGWMG